jgi:HlyD family secretion protein
MKNFILLLLAGTILVSACNNTDDQADAYGNFESNDQLVTTEIPGRLIFLNIEEGQTLKEGDTIALVDTMQLHLQKQQLKSSIRAIRGKLQHVQPQIDLVKKQIEVLQKEKTRIEGLVKVEAATPQQLDDIQGKIDVAVQQIKTTEEQNKLANAAILSQIPPLESQIVQLDDQISRCFIINPVAGTVLLKLAEPGEIAFQTKPLYKIADISTLYLRAFVSGEQLPAIRIGQKVYVEIDKDEETNQRIEGEVSWISEKAEFTPKTIQTKEERVNLVYAFKTKVDNASGKLKIGMPGEVHFNTAEQDNN